MSFDPPDPRTLKSWEDAFQYPLPVTRQLEKKLRSDVASNKERLRNLVGASYRDLLGTAERISQLDQQMQETESRLSDASMKCNVRVVERKVDEAQQMRSAHASNERHRRIFSGELILLQKCKTTVLKLLKIRGSVLTCAKLLTISRLLHKTLIQNDSSVDLLETLRKQIASLRKALLKQIDSHLASPKTSIEGLTKAICAFCLATSSSSTDAVKRFQHVRLEEIRRQLDQFDVGHKNLSRALQLYVQTLNTSRSLLGRRMSDAFRSLRSQPLLQDLDLQQHDEHAFDTYGPWVSIEVQNFVPWVRYIETTRTEAVRGSKEWSKVAFERLSAGLKAQLRSVETVDEVLIIRKELLSIWLPVWSSTTSHGPGVVLNGFRQIFNDRINAIVHSQSNGLERVGSQLSATVYDVTPQHGLTLWDDRFASSPLTDGASIFKSEVMRRHHGLSGDTVTLAVTLNSWIFTIQDNKDIISKLENTKWSDIIEDEEDEDSDLDDEVENGDTEPTATARSIERLLQKSDPEVLAAAQKDSIQTAITAFQDSVADLSRSLISSDSTPVSETDVAKSCFILRTIRIFSQQLSAAFPDADLSKLHSEIPSQHSNIAKFIVHRVSASNSNIPSKATTMVHLWEPANQPTTGIANGTINGSTPTSTSDSRPLPTIPTPSVYKFLHSLVTDMSSLGPDLWTPSAVTTLKESLWPMIESGKLNTSLGLLIQNPSTSNEAELNGKPSNTDSQPPDTESSTTTTTTSSPPNDSHSPNHQIQSQFNVLYLSDFLLPASIQSTPAITSLSDSEKEILARRARAYWERTRGLFGILNI